MRSTIVLFACVLMSWAACAAQEAAVPWPRAGARFPDGGDPPRPAISADRLGASYWVKPPAVMSPCDPSWFDYVTIVWGGDSRLKGKQEYFDALKKMYVSGTMVYSQADPAPTVKAGMPFYATCITNLLYIRNKSGPGSRRAFKKERTRANCVRKPSLEDPETDQSERRNAARVADRCGKFKPVAYDLRDEATYVVGSASPFDFDFSEVSLAHFRKWLKAKYGSLDALNKEWGTDFSAWKDAVPLMTDEIQKREFGKIATTNLAPWADHREYNDDTFMAAIARYRDEILQRDPGSPIGISGTQMPSAYGGFDFWKMCRTVSWIEHYDACGSRELMRSFLPRRYPLIAAMRYQSSVDQGLMRLWYLVLHGDTGGLVWPYGRPVGKTLMLDVDGDKITLTRAGKNLRDIFGEARGGIPCLINHADLQVEPVAVLHSQASLRADWMFEVKRDKKDWANRYSSWEGSHNYAAAGRVGYFKLLEDMGYQYTCLADQQVADGELAKRGVKLLLVPRAMALSKKEIRAMKAFVEAGGVLVTDLMAGRMNESCRVWSRGSAPMDDLLGVKRAAFAFEEDLKGETKSGYKGGFGRWIDVTMASAFGDLKAGETFKIQGFQEPHLAAGAAKALATTPTGPAILARKLGRGMVYTLNFDIPNYLKRRSGKDAPKLTAPHRKVFAALLAKAGVTPRVKVSVKGTGRHPVGLETFCYTQGRSRYVAVLRNKVTRINWQDLSDSGEGVVDVSGRPLVFKLPRKGHVTELRTGKGFGLTDRVEIVMPKDRPLIFSILPYKVTALRADVGKGKIADGKLALSVSVEASGKAGDHVVHAELVTKAGEVIPESAVNLPLPGGSYKGAIDLSHVKEAGPFKLRLRDVASGRTTTLNVKR